MVVPKVEKGRECVVYSDAPKASKGCVSVTPDSKQLKVDRQIFCTH